MKLGILTNYDLQMMGGAEETLDRLAGIWTELGHQVTVFCPRARSCKKPRRPWNPVYGVEVCARPWSTRFGLGRYVRQLGQFHKTKPLDLLLACDAYWPGHVARLFSEATGVPYVLCSQGSDIMEGSRFLNRFLTHRRMMDAINGAHGIVYVSSYMKWRTQFLANPQCPMRLIPNGWPDEWLQNNTLPAVVKRPYYFAMGRMVALKGFQTAIDAYAMLARNPIKQGLVLAGDGNYLQELIAKARALGLPVQTGPDWQPAKPPWVWFPGSVSGDKKQSLVQHAFVGIVPSIRQEPLGMVILEMLASGVPVVGSDVGGIPDIIQPGKNGELVTAGDAPALAQCLAELERDPARCDQLASNARSSVLSLRWSEVANNYLQLFTELLGTRPLRQCA